MKALSLWQPWASAIAAGLKQYETRHWATKYRGPLAIAATKTTPRAYDNFFGAIEAREKTAFAEIWVFGAKDLPRSAIVCVGLLTDCVLMTDELIAATPAAEKRWGVWAPGRYAWKIEVVKIMTPAVPIKRCGRTLFNWDEVPF